MPQVHVSTNNPLISWVFLELSFNLYASKGSGGGSDGRVVTSDLSLNPNIGKRKDKNKEKELEIAHF